LSLQADANEHLRQRATYDDGNYAQQHRGRAAAQADDHFRGPQLDPACPFGGNVSSFLLCAEFSASSPFPVSVIFNRERKCAENYDKRHQNDFSS